MYGGGGAPSAEQVSYNSSTSVVSDPSSLKSVSTNSLGNVKIPSTQNGGMCRQVEFITAHSKKLQDDLQELGLKIKHHEENVKYLMTLKSNLDGSIVDMQAALGKFDKASFVQTKKEYPELVISEDETIQNILKHENSGAAILCRMKIQEEALSVDHSLTKDVVGIVATLGKVNDGNFSRLLSEYLGLETMLAVVCKTYEGVGALEAYTSEGSIDTNRGLHGFAASIGKTMTDRFLVICLEDLRPYPGEFIADDPQRRLALQKPRLPNGETPSGFLGFAVNMITIDSRNLYCISKNGGSLRETLFYHLFSNLQVYRTREDMVKALACIRNGAISLDGGMIRSSGVFSIGKHEIGIDLKFPTDSKMFNLPEGYLETENGIKEAKWKRDRTCEDIKREQDLFTLAKLKFEKKKQELIQFLAQSSSNISQYGTGGGSTPR